MNRIEIHQLLDEALKHTDHSSIERELKKMLVGTPASEKVLTIVANAGVHKIPEEYLRGEVYEASIGDWNISTQEELKADLEGILSALAAKLRLDQWQRVYLIPTGHPILSIQIKAMIYRILRINSIDMFYKSGKYMEVDLDQRAIALKADKRDE